MEILLYGGWNILVTWQRTEFKIKADHSPVGPRFTRMEERKDDQAHTQAGSAVTLQKWQLKQWSAKSLFQNAEQEGSFYQTVQIFRHVFYHSDDTEHMA